MVDGTNIVNLLEEWSRLNSISADNAGFGGGAVVALSLGDGTTLLGVLHSGEVIDPDKGRRRVFTSLMS